VIALDDAVFWGAVPLMMEANDVVIADRARRLWHRDLPKCIDVRLILEQETPHEHSADQKARGARNARIQRRCQQIVAAVEAWASGRPASEPPVLIDQVRRQPYKRYGESRTMLNQILIRYGADSSLDMADISPVVASAETFEVCRIYITEGDSESKTMITNIMRTPPEESTNVTL
jgi:hypothetical protein